MVPLISQSFDGRLDFSARLMLKFHLLVCAWCARYLRQIELIRQLAQLRAGEDDFESQSLTAEARERISKKVNGEW